MKYTVPLLLLVAIGHAAEPKSSRKQQDLDDYKSMKRELIEGNYGLRIKPSVSETALQSTPQPEYINSYEHENYLQSQEYSQPQAPQPEYRPPVAKISDVLTGQGPSFPAAIAGHLYSPLSVYQPRLGSPTTFEISTPEPSELYYHDHKTFNDDFLRDAQLSQNSESLRQPQPQLVTTSEQQNYEKQESLRNTNQNSDQRPLSNVQEPLTIKQGESYEQQENLIQNFDPQKNFVTPKQNGETTKESQAEQDRQQSQQQPFQVNVAELPDHLPSHPGVIEPFLHLEPSQAPPIYSEPSNQQYFPLVEGYPPDFFQQIRQLGNQLDHSKENDQYIISPEDDQANREAVKQNEQNPEQNASQQIQSTKHEVEGFPPDFFQQIRQLGNQLTPNEENTQTSVSPEDDQANRETVKQNEQNPKQNASQIQSSTETQTSVLQVQSSTISPIQNNQPQATSYARFSQGFSPPTFGVQDSQQEILLQPLPFPSPVPQFQPLPLPQEPQLFQPLLELQPPRLLQPSPNLPLQPVQQTTPQPQPLFRLFPSQPTAEPIQQTPPQPQPLFRLFPSQPTAEPIQQTTPQPQPLFRLFPSRPTAEPIITAAPFKPLFSALNQPPKRIGIIRIRPENNQVQNLNRQFSSHQPQLLSLPQNQQTLSTLRPQFTRFPQNQLHLTTQQPQLLSLTQNQFTSTSHQPEFPPLPQNQQFLSTFQPQFTRFPHKQQSLTTRQPQFPSLPQNEQYLTSKQPLFPSFSQNRQESTTRQPPFPSLPQNEQYLTSKQPLFPSFSQNRQESTTRQPQFTPASQKQQTLSTTQSQFLYLPPKEKTLNTYAQDQETFSTNSQNDQTVTTRQPESLITQAVTLLNSEPTLASQEFDDSSNEVPTVSSSSIFESSSQSTESYSTPASVSTESSSTLPTRSTSPQQPLTTSQFQVPFSSTIAFKTLPSQPVTTEASSSTILTSVQPLSTLAPVSRLQPTSASLQTSEPEPIQLSTQPQKIHSVQILNSLETLSNQPILVTPQPLLTLQPYPVSLQSVPHETSGVINIPVQRYQIQPESQHLLQVQHLEHQQPLQLVQVQPTVPVPVHFQPTPSPTPQQLQVQSQQLVQQQQSQYQSAELLQSLAPSQQQVDQQQQEQSQIIQQQSQQDKEVAIAHAQKLLYELYSPFLQHPVYETQEHLIQHPHSAPLAVPSSYSVSFPNFPAIPSTQYFEKQAHIHGGHLPHYHYKKK